MSLSSALQAAGEFCSSAGGTTSPSLSSDLGVCRAPSLTSHSLPDTVAQYFFSFFKNVFADVLLTD